MPADLSQSWRGRPGTPGLRRSLLRFCSEPLSVGVRGATPGQVVVVTMVAQVPLPQPEVDGVHLAAGTRSGARGRQPDQLRHGGVPESCGKAEVWPVRLPCHNLQVEIFDTCGFFRGEHI